MHDLGDLDWLSLTFSCYLRCLSFFTISTQRNLNATRLFLVSLVLRIDKPWGNTLREKLHEPCACGIQIGGAKERQQHHEPRDTSNPHDVINYSSSKGDHHWSSSSFCDSGFARAYTSFMRPKIVYLTNSVSHVDYIVTRSLKLQ